MPRLAKDRTPEPVVPIGRRRLRLGAALALTKDVRYLAALSPDRHRPLDARGRTSR
jgi:hypothetical protein